MEKTEALVGNAHYNSRDFFLLLIMKRSTSSDTNWIAGINGKGMLLELEIKMKIRQMVNRHLYSK